MNLRNVLRAYSLLRQMSDEELAQLEIWRGATDAERALIVEALSDKPQKKSSKKPAGKGGSGKSSKSPRASGMAAQLNAQLGGRRQEALADIAGESGEPVRAADDKCADCVHLFGNNVHHLPSVEGYHQFQPAEQAAATSGD